MRKTFLFTVLLLCTTIVWAEERSEREAKTLAMRFLSAKDQGVIDSKKEMRRPKDKDYEKKIIIHFGNHVCKLAGNCRE